MARRGDKKTIAETGDPEGLDVWTRRYLEYLAERNYSVRTAGGSEAALRLFIDWALDRGLARPDEITKPILEHYQRWLFHYRKPSGKPLTFVSQRDRLQKLRNFFRFLTRQNVIPSNPASELDLPRVERRLPRDVLTAGEMEKVLAQPDLSDPLGLRDRAMMEVFYSTGLRRNELTSLDLFDLDAERGALMVRLGKGKKDRIVPIGERAIAWVARYLDTGRAELAVSDSERAIFLSEHGGRLDPGYLTHLMGEYIERAKVNKRGACHIFRHTMATLMLEGGADIRHIQEILGHAETSTTAIYTRVSIQHLKLVHDATHPAAKLSKPKSEQASPTSASAPPDEESGKSALEHALLASLAAEAAEEDAGGGSSSHGRQLELWRDP